MIPQTIIRGNLARFSAIFYDATGAVASPSSAAVIVNYLNEAGARVDSDPIEMSQQTDGSFYAEWDSSAAQPARVYWSAKAVSPAGAQDGLFDLEANPANLAT